MLAVMTPHMDVLIVYLCGYGKGLLSYLYLYIYVSPTLLWIYEII